MGLKLSMGRLLLLLVLSLHFGCAADVADGTSDEREPWDDETASRSSELRTATNVLASSDCEHKVYGCCWDSFPVTCDDGSTREATVDGLAAARQEERAPGYQVALPPQRRGPTEITTRPPPVTHGELAAGIVSRLQGQVSGFGLAIAFHGAVTVQTGGGQSRMAPLDGAQPYTATTVQNVMSVSKTLTGIAALQLMDDLNVDPDDPIGPWLPAAWSPGSGFGQHGISFADLLRHRSGLKQTSLLLAQSDGSYAGTSKGRWDGLRMLVESGVDPTVAGTGGTAGYAGYSYSNINYDLARVILANMAVAAGHAANNHELGAEINAAAVFQGYVQDHVLEPAGVTSRVCYPSGPEETRTRYYDTEYAWAPWVYSSGTSPGDFDWLMTCGSRNWHLSAVDLVKVLGALRTGQLLSPVSRGHMNDLKLGWSNSSDIGSNADLFWHGGLLKWNVNRSVLYMPGSPFNPTPQPLWQSRLTRTEANSCVAQLPYGLDVALVINSDIRNSNADACSVIRAAFHAAD